MSGLFLLFAIVGLFSQEVFLSQAEVIQRRPSKETLKSWLNSDDDVLATENTPVYGIKEKETLAGTPIELLLTKYQDGMKQVADYLKNYKPDVILQPTYNLSETNKTSSNHTVVYPEILVIVDYFFYQTLGANFYDAVEYTLAYWNGVDMMFRSLEQPKIRLNIAGILLIEHPDALPFVEDDKPNELDDWSTMIKIGEWLYNIKHLIPIDSYDIAFVMTRKDFEQSSLDESRSLHGTAIANGTCRYSENGIIYKVAMVNDFGDFSTIRSTAHELAHSLGVRHDGWDETKCSSDNGAIMTENLLVGSPRSYEWSQCSLQDFTRAFSLEQYSCIQNRPKEGNPVPRILPGKLMSLDEQCSNLIPNAEAVINDEVCSSLYCMTFGERNQEIQSTVGAAEGSPCGDGKICLSGECFEEKFIN